MCVWISRLVTLLIPFSRYSLLGLYISSIQLFLQHSISCFTYRLSFGLGPPSYNLQLNLLHTVIVARGNESHVCPRIVTICLCGEVGCVAVGVCFRFVVIIMVGFEVVDGPFGVGFGEGMLLLLLLLVLGR